MFSRNPEVDPHEKMGTATEKWLVRESHLSKSSVLLISALFCLCTFSKLKVSHSTWVYTTSFSRLISFAQFWILQRGTPIALLSKVHTWRLDKEVAYHFKMRSPNVTLEISRKLINILYTEVYP